MRTVYHAESIIDAHLVKDYLEQAGIPAFIAGEYLTGGIGQLPARDYLSVGVPNSCEPAALPLVQEMVAVLSDARQRAERGSDNGGLAPGLVPVIA